MRFTLEGIAFDPDTQQITSDPTLDAVASLLSNQFPNARIRIEGYTDATGTSAGAADVSQTRANAVKQYLTGRGVNDSRIDAQGRAPAPAGSKQGATGQSTNGQVALVVVSR